MHQKILDKVLESLNRKTQTESSTTPYFSDKRYKPFKIDKDNFKKIEDTKNDKKIAFIDGGNAEILKANNFSLQFIRIYYSIYHNLKKIKAVKEEAYILVHGINKDGNIKYKTDIFGSSLITTNDLTIDLHEKSLAEGLHEVNISKIGDLTRRLMELKIAEKVIESLDKEDVIVLDGTLQSSLTNENRYFDSLYNKALSKGVIITALAKTFSLFTDQGTSLSRTLNNIAPKTSWYYYPIADINHPEHMAELFMAKFHENSQHVFRLEVYKENKFNISQITSLLKSFSQDPVFPGYPYGLVDADRNARVSNKERDYLFTLLMSRAGKSWKKIEEFLTTTNAHSILDNIG